jgi:MraZ protein
VWLVAHDSTCQINIMFTGVYDLTIDDKNRLSIPSGLRGSMDPDKQGADFYLAPGEREHTLELFPDKYYRKYVDELHRALTDSPEAADFELFFTSMSALLEIDKQGRVLLPQQQIQFAGIGRQVTLLGNRDRLVLLNRENGQSFVQSTWPRYREMKQAAKRRDVPAAGGAVTPEGPGARS